MRRMFVMLLASINLGSAALPSVSFDLPSTATSSEVVYADYHISVTGRSKMQWMCEWGDGTSLYGVGYPPTLSHLYLFGPGVYSASLIVIDKNGVTAAATDIIEIE